MGAWPGFADSLIMTHFSEDRARLPIGNGHVQWSAWRGPSSGLDEQARSGVPAQAGSPRYNVLGQVTYAASFSVGPPA